MTGNKHDLSQDEHQEIVEEIFAEDDQNETIDNEVQDEEVPKNTLEQKLLETEGRYLRLYADFENYRRRVKLDAEAAQKYRAQALVTNLVPALDSFKKALQTDSQNEETKALLQGMEMVYKSIIFALAEEGVEVIEAVGNEFDPHLHQAIMQDQNPEFASNIVVEEFQVGYKLKDRVIRPSMVKVNQ